MTDTTEKFLATWHDAVATQNTEAITQLLEGDITLGAPPYWDKLCGQAVVGHLLGLIVVTIEDFTYHREWTDEGELALEFTGRVGDLKLQGIDLITLSAGGRIQNLDVLMRPMCAIAALRDVIGPKMIAFFASLEKEKQA